MCCKGGHYRGFFVYAHYRSAQMTLIGTWGGGSNKMRCRIRIRLVPAQIKPSVQVWRLARPLQDLEMLLTEPLLSCPCCVFRVIVMLEDPAMTHLQCSYWGKEVVGQNLTIHGPIHPPFNTVQSSCPLCRKAPPKHDVSTPCFTVGMVFLGLYSSFFFLQKRRVEFIPKSYILVSSDHTL